MWESMFDGGGWIVESSPPITASQYSNWDYILDNIATTKS